MSICLDDCPNDPNKIAPGLCGCGTADTDSDSDGIPDSFSGGSLPETDTLPAAGVLLTGGAFGDAIAGDGVLAVVRLPFDDLPSKADAGSARVYSLVGSTWTQVAELLVPSLDTESKDAFGASVSIHGDVVPVTASDKLVAAGATRDDETGKTGCGAVYIHALSSTGTASTVTRVISPSSLASAGLGASVSVDATGTRVAAGAPLADPTGGGTDAATATVWTLVGSAWTGVEAVPPDRIAGENFGASVSLRADGRALVVGSPFDTVGGIAKRGSAIVFTSSEAAWSSYDRLTLPASGTSASNFGRSVAFRGTSILVGGPKHTPPAGGTVRSFGGP